MQTTDTNTAPDAEAVRDRALVTIAAEELGLDTLEDRGLDDLDFHDLHVAGVRAALEAAYAAGRAAALSEVVEEVLEHSRRLCQGCGHSVGQHTGYGCRWQVNLPRERCGCKRFEAPEDEVSR